MTLDTIYYTDEECLQKLAKEDLVFPLSGDKGVLQRRGTPAIASGAAVAVTPLTIFEDVTGRYPIRWNHFRGHREGISNVLDWTADERENHSQRRRVACRIPTL